MIATMDGTHTQITDQFIPDVNTASHDALPKARTLDQLGKGEHAIVAAINPSLAFGSLDALVTRRLWELGFLPGAPISVVGFGLLNRDPVAVKIGGTKFALRRVEAQKVLVTSSNSDTSNQKTVAQ